MVRSLILILTVSGALFAGSARCEAQVIVHRPNGNNKGLIASRSHGHSAEATHFSAQPVYPTRFHATPIYPRTTFWSLDYPNTAVGPMAYSLGELSQLGQPTYYPGTDIPFGRPDFDAMLR
jgi:hypothetical protein